MLSEPPAQVAPTRNFERELEFLRNRVRALARGRFPDEQEDVASDAWIRLDRALRRGGARNEEALMTRIAWRAWVDFFRRKKSASGVFGAPVPIEGIDVGEDEADPSVDPEALAIWRFAVYEWFAQHQPRCVDPARQLFSGRNWVEAGAELGERPNSLAKRWQRCKDQFLESVRQDRGMLREILDYFERAAT